MEDLSRLPPPRVPRTMASGARQPDRLRAIGGAQQIRLLYCRTCKARFRAQGHPAVPLRIAAEQAAAGPGRSGSPTCNGVRAICAGWSAHRDTVVRYSRPWARACPATSTTSSWLFPRPSTRSSSMRSGPTSTRSSALRLGLTRLMISIGRLRDHVAYDPEHKPVLGVLSWARPRRPRRWSPTSTVARRSCSDHQRYLPGQRGVDPARRWRGGDDDASGSPRAADDPRAGAAAGADLRAFAREEATSGPGGGDPGPS